MGFLLRKYANSHFYSKGFKTGNESVLVLIRFIRDVMKKGRREDIVNTENICKT